MKITCMCPAWLAASLMSRPWFSVSSLGTPGDQDWVTGWWKGLSLGRKRAGLGSHHSLDLGSVVLLPGQHFAEYQPLTCSAGCLDHMSLGIFASSLLFFMIYDAHSFIICVDFNPSSILPILQVSNSQTHSFFMI